MFLAKRNQLAGCNKALDVCMKFLDEHLEIPKEKGRYELGDGIYCVITGYDTILEKDSVIEAHRKYEDLHCGLSGEERVKFGFTDDLQIVGYEEAKDFVELNGELPNELIVKPGNILCFMPNDAHCMKLSKDENVSEKIEKIIFKIPLEQCEYMW